MELRVASAHANKIRANGHRMPSSDQSTPNAPGSSPGRTRSNFYCTHLSLVLVVTGGQCLSVSSSTNNMNRLVLIPSSWRIAAACTGWLWHARASAPTDYRGVPTAMHYNRMQHTATPRSEAPGKPLAGSFKPAALNSLE